MFNWPTVQCYHSKDIDTIKNCMQNEGLKKLGELKCHQYACMKIEA